MIEHRKKIDFLDCVYKTKSENMNGRFVGSEDPCYYRIFCEEGIVTVGEYWYNSTLRCLHEMSGMTVAQAAADILNSSHNTNQYTYKADD